MLHTYKHTYVTYINIHMLHTFQIYICYIHKHTYVTYINERYKFLSVPHNCLEIYAYLCRFMLFTLIHLLDPCIFVLEHADLC